MRAAIRRWLATAGLVAAIALPIGCGERPPSYLPMGGPTARSAVVELDPAKRPRWGMQGADFRRSGVALDTGPEQVRRLWSTPVPAPGAAQVSVAADGTVFLTGQEEGNWHLVAVSAQGRVLWRNNLGASGPFTPAIDPRGETVYALAGAPEPYLFAFRLDGARQWELALGRLIGWPDGQAFWAPGSFPNPALLVGEGGTVFVSAGNGLVAVEPTGRVKWIWTGGGATVDGIGSPAQGPDRSLYVPARFAGHGWFLVHLSEFGQEDWRYALPERPSTPAVGMDGLAHVVVDSGAGPQMVTVRINGKRRWSQPLDLPKTGTSTWLDDDAMPALAWDALVGHLVISSRGSQAMSLPQGFVAASPVALDTANRRYLLARNSDQWQLVAVSSAGQVLWTEPLGQPASYPVVGFQRIYVVEQGNTGPQLVALGGA